MEFEQDCTKIELENLSDEDIRSYLKKFGIHPYSLPISFDVIRNPLILSMMPDLLQEPNFLGVKELPKNKSEIYGKFFERIINSWDQQKGVRFTVATPFHIEAFMGRLAYSYFDKNFISKRDFNTLLHHDFQTLALEITNITMNTKLIRPVSDDSYMFSHKSWKEYFTATAIYAQYILTRNECSEEFKEILQNESYFDVIVFLLGLCTDADIQNRLLNMILEYNLKLYIHCTDSRARIEDNRYNHANKESVAEYFEVFINTYERIINTHFPQIKRFFYPFTDDYEVKGYKLGILVLHI